MSSAEPEPGWIAAAAARIAAAAPARICRLVDISTPSGDCAAAERAVAAVVAMLPLAAAAKRLPCSTPAHAPDLLATLTGRGSGRVVLLGHLDTVVAHRDHRPFKVDGERIDGSGIVDMKGGDVLAIGLFEELAARPEWFERLALLFVNDEEWRRHGFGHRDRFAGWEACLCFEAGELGLDGADAVVVRRKAATTLRVIASGVSAHSGANPDDGASALLALAKLTPELAALHDADGFDRLTVVPTVLRSGEALNVVPDRGELLLDLRADRADAFDSVLAAVPSEIDSVSLRADFIRLWPAMDSRESAAPALAAAAQLLGRPIVAGSRGGASDASHLAARVRIAIDGLGPIGGGAHAPDEHILASSLRPRAEVALALALATLGAGFEPSPC